MGSQCNGAVHGPRIQMLIAKALRQEPGYGALSGPRWAVDGNNDGFGGGRGLGDSDGRVQISCLPVR
jgi:hypothetical protein